MNLSSAAERQGRRSESMSREECTSCGTLGHFRAECPRRLAKEARDLRMAQLGFAAPAAPVSVPAASISGNVQSRTA
jgi:hypothetical protein